MNIRTILNYPLHRKISKTNLVSRLVICFIYLVDNSLIQDQKFVKTEP